jgi:carbon starvation protein CstA
MDLNLLNSLNSIFIFLISIATLINIINTLHFFGNSIDSFEEKNLNYNSDVISKDFKNHTILEFNKLVFTLTQIVSFLYILIITYIGVSSTLMPFEMLFALADFISGLVLIVILIFSIGVIILNKVTIEYIKHKNKLFIIKMKKLQKEIDEEENLNDEEDDWYHKEKNKE